ncbi:MAG: hypothetical protein Q7T29_06805 [Gallionella sp.]|nr:hypothetical protein [Gallionella sp.]
MTNSHDIPRFPDIGIPDKLTESVSHEIENNDIDSENELHHLVSLIYEHPEHQYYLYIEKGCQINKWVKHAIDSGWLLAHETEFFYYRHPRSPQREFIQIRERMIKFDWQREVVNTQPMFMRVTLTLSEKTKRHLEIEQLLNAQNVRNSNPLKLEPNFMGIGVDLKKAITWLKRRSWRL